VALTREQAINMVEQGYFSNVGGGNPPATQDWKSKERQDVI
jgi:hypothetical protein|tara:strand:- start:365 stop:487 length:123 start_codon:yes stop_codon:yes gene_type:complete